MGFDWESHPRLMGEMIEQSHDPGEMIEKASHDPRMGEVVERHLMVLKRSLSGNLILDSRAQRSLSGNLILDGCEV